LSEIYLDLENIYDGTIPPTEDPVWVIKQAQSFIHGKSAELNARRWGNFARECGWMLLGICANSRTFQRASLQKTEIWTPLRKLIVESFHSLEMFAKARGIDWETPLMTGLEMNISTDMEGIPVRQTMDLDPDHPHHYALLGVVPVRCQYKGRDQVNIDKCVYNPTDFPRRHPLARQKGECINCGEHGCQCNGSDALEALVEINDHGSPLGRGVRTLIDIKSGENLAEYTGRIYHPQVRMEDTTYFFQHVYAQGEKVQGKPKTNVYIDSAVEGNWTRYINHSCNSNLESRQRNLGEYSLIFIIAVRDIPAFTELSLNYGRSYFEGGSRYCSCREPNCQFPDRRARGNHL